MSATPAVVRVPQQVCALQPPAYDASLRMGRTIRDRSTIDPGTVPVPHTRPDRGAIRVVDRSLVVGKKRLPSRDRHCLSPFPRRAESSTVEVGRQLGNEEWELLGHVHAHEKLLGHVRLAVGIGEDDFDNPP